MDSIQSGEFDSTSYFSEPHFQQLYFRLLWWSHTFFPQWLYAFLLIPDLMFLFPFLPLPLDKIFSPQFYLFILLILVTHLRLRLFSLCYMSSINYSLSFQHFSLRNASFLFPYWCATHRPLVLIRIVIEWVYCDELFSATYSYVLAPARNGSRRYW